MNTFDRSKIHPKPLAERVNKLNILELSEKIKDDPASLSDGAFESVRSAAAAIKRACRRGVRVS